MRTILTVMVLAALLALSVVHTRIHADNNTKGKPTPTPTPTPKTGGGGNNATPELILGGVYDTTGGPLTTMSIRGFQTGNGTIGDKWRGLEFLTENSSIGASQDVIAGASTNFSQFGEQGALIWELHSPNGGNEYGAHLYVTDVAPDGSTSGQPAQMVSFLGTIARHNCNTPDCQFDKAAAPFIADTGGAPQPADAMLMPWQSSRFNYLVEGVKSVGGGPIEVRKGGIHLPGGVPAIVSTDGSIVLGTGNGQVTLTVGVDGSLTVTTRKGSRAIL